MRRVLHLKMITQCAMLEELGIFLVLADKVTATAFLPSVHTIADMCASPYLHITLKLWSLHHIAFQT